MVNYFTKKQNVPQSTICYILKKYLQCGTTKDLPRSGRPVKLSDKNLDNLIKSVNNVTESSKTNINCHTKTSKSSENG